MKSKYLKLLNLKERDLLYVPVICISEFKGYGYSDCLISILHRDRKFKLVKFYRTDIKLLDAAVDICFEKSIPFVITHYDDDNFYEYDMFISFTSANSFTKLYDKVNYNDYELAILNYYKFMELI